MTKPELRTLATEDKNASRARHKIEYGSDIFLKSGYFHNTGEVKGLYGIGVRYTGGYRYNQRIKAIKMDRL